MDAVINLLGSYHWQRASDLESNDGYTKPVFHFRNWKALVGKVWTTIWFSAVDGNVQMMRSVKTAAPEVVDAEIKRVIADVAAPKSGKK